MSELWITLYDQIFPDGIRAVDTGGRLPIHRSCAAMDPSSTMETRLLIEKYPEECSIIDAEGRLPLHIALENHASREQVQLLLLANPASTRVPDKMVVCLYTLHV